MDWLHTVKRNIGSLSDGQVFSHFGTKYTRKELDPINRFVRATFGKHEGHVIFHPETVVVIPKEDLNE